MKKLHLLWIVAVLFCFTACKKNNAYKIEGLINNVNGETIYLQKLVNKQFETIDSTIAKDNKFVFKGSVEMPDMYQIKIANIDSLNFFIENSDIKITFNTEDIYESVIIGSKTNDLYKNYELDVKPLNDKVESIYMKYVEARKNNDTLLAKQMNEALALAEKELKDSTLNFVHANSNSIVAAFVARSIASDLTLDEMDNLVKKFDPSLKNTRYVAWMENKVTALKNTAVGKPFADFSIPDSNGVVVKLSDIAGKGNYILIDFWASWCGPCRREMPQVVELYNKYKDKGFEIISVSCDTDRNRWLSTAKQLNMTWHHVSELKRFDMKAIEDYGIMGIPHLVLLDKNGIILTRSSSADIPAQKLDELFASETIAKK